MQTVNLDQTLKEGLGENTGFLPNLGKIGNHTNFYSFTQTNVEEPCFHIFIKKRTEAMIALNLRADKAVADCFLKVLEDRYPKGSYKIEFYGEYAKRVKVDSVFFHNQVHDSCFCIVLKENVMNGTDKYREETLKLLDDSLRDLKKS